MNYSYETYDFKAHFTKAVGISWFFFLIWGEKMTFCDNKICHFDILNKFYITCIKVFFLLPLQILIEMIF